MQREKAPLTASSSGSSCLLECSVSIFEKSDAEPDFLGMPPEIR